MAKNFSDKVYKMANILDSKKASDILLLDVQDITILSDYFIICSGNVANHVKMLADELENALEKEGIHKIRMEGYQEGRWIVLDYGDVLVHIFHREEREFYSIERLWKSEDNFEEFAQ